MRILSVPTASFAMTERPGAGARPREGRSHVHPSGLVPSRAHWRYHPMLLCSGPGTLVCLLTAGEPRQQSARPSQLHRAQKRRGVQEQWQPGCPCGGHVSLNAHFAFPLPEERSKAPFRGHSAFASPGREPPRACESQAGLVRHRSSHQFILRPNATLTSLEAA